jgi:two-component system sensor histidine kinase LytS
MGLRRLSSIEVVFIAAIVLFVAIAVITLVFDARLAVIVICVLAVIGLVFVMVRYSVDPDRLRARQSERTLRLAAQTMPFMQQGLTPESAQEVCKLLLPATLATAVSITDMQCIMGYVGAESEAHPVGSPISTKATRKAINEGATQVVLKADDIGFADEANMMQAAIIVPLILRDKPAGVLKFYYRSAERIDETQRAMAEGFGTLLSMQLSLAELEFQRELATKMSLKALQAQINPHFLFNTINTIAALIRTNPAQARILLREFAVFYRRTLEGSLDMITLEQEHLQTLRYLGFELARFGQDRIIYTSSIEPDIEQTLVPAFIIQPLVENAVAHAMKDDAPLHIDVRASIADGLVNIVVTDDGIGIPKDEVAEMLNPRRERGGVAILNVDERLRGYYGSRAGLAVQSELGSGTTITMTLGEPDCLTRTGSQFLATAK